MVLLICEVRETLLWSIWHPAVSETGIEKSSYNSSSLYFFYVEEGVTLATPTVCSENLTSLYTTMIPTEYFVSLLAYTMRNATGLVMLQALPKRRISFDLQESTTPHAHADCIYQVST